MTIAMTVAVNPIRPIRPIRPICLHLHTLDNLDRLEVTAIHALHASGQGLVAEENDRHLIALGHIKGQNYQAIAIGDIGGRYNKNKRTPPTGGKSETHIG